MLDERTPRQRRRAATRAEILDAAWNQCRSDGLASLSLRQLAAAVGMRAPSLYSYFDSKDAIYDAMFRDAQEQLGEWMAGIDAERPVTRAVIKRGTRRWFEFCVADPVRYQLMFQRVIPGFEPSPESYAIAVERLDGVVAVLRDAGIGDQARIDLFTALITGLTSQQISNDPGGDRWIAILDDAVDMYLDHAGVLP